MTNFKLLIEYDGSPFFGWQRQADKPSVQEEIEKHLSRMLNHSTRISGSGRTDAGVHATGQVANFHSDTSLLPHQIKRGLNSLIKRPVVIHDCRIVPSDFHAQYSALSKEYHYVILNRENPCAIGRNYQWHIRHPLDIDAMSQCCVMILGTHDFKSFENTGSPRSTTVRKIFHAGFEPPEKDRIVFKICADGFLKNMVRNIIGTLVYVGSGKIGPRQFINILAACDRKKAGVTAPPHGLFLKKVTYS